MLHLIINTVVLGEKKNHFHTADPSLGDVHVHPFHKDSQEIN